MLPDGVEHLPLLLRPRDVTDQEQLRIPSQLRQRSEHRRLALGATSTRCQGAGPVTYTATATNNTGLSYSLDAASITGGNSINTSTGAVTYLAGWTGTSTITVTATGCNGPSTATHTVTITPTVGTPSIYSWCYINTLPGSRGCELWRIGDNTQVSPIV